MITFLIHPELGTAQIEEISSQLKETGLAWGHKKAAPVSGTAFVRSVFPVAFYFAA